MKAIMLAAGRGTRCYPFTYMYPKLFQQVCGIPVIEYMFSWFHALPDCERVYLVVNHESPLEKINDYLTSRKTRLPDIKGLFERLGYVVDYTNADLAVETIEAFGHGTGGDLRLAIDTIDSKDGLSEDILVCNADYVTLSLNHDGLLSPQLNLMDMFSYHRTCKRQSGTVMTIALATVGSDEARSYGVAQVERRGDALLIKEFAEKPTARLEAAESLINAGIYFVDRDFISHGLDIYLPNGPQTSLEKTLIGKLTAQDEGKLAGFLLPLHRWFDIGTLERLVDANICLIEEGKAARKAAA